MTERCPSSRRRCPRRRGGRTDAPTGRRAGARSSHAGADAGGGGRPGRAMLRYTQAVSSRRHRATEHVPQPTTAPRSRQPRVDETEGDLHRVVAACDGGAATRTDRAHHRNIGAVEGRPGHRLSLVRTNDSAWIAARSKCSYSASGSYSSLGSPCRSVPPVTCLVSCGCLPDRDGVTLGGVSRLGDWPSTLVVEPLSRLSRFDTPSNGR